MKEEELSPLPVLKVDVVERGRTPRKHRVGCEIGKNLRFKADALASYFFSKWNPLVFDALLLAAAVEFCDRSQRRPKLGWGRKFELQLPVHDVACWTRDEVEANLRRVLEFLTGDRWHIGFVQRKMSELPAEQGLFELP